MDTAVIDNFERFVAILKVGGGYAGWALTVWWLLRIDRRLAKATDDLKDIAMAKVENDVKTEETLKANAQGLEGLSSTLHGIGDKLLSIKNCLEKVLLIKGSKLKIEE